MEKILQSIKESLILIQKHAKVNPEEMIDVLRGMDEDLRDILENCVPPGQ